jgi:hypothetical protein
MAEMKESGTTFFIELYRVELPDHTLLLASSDEDITFNGETYLGYPIKRGDITRTVDSRVDNCDIEVSNTNDYFTLTLLNGKNFLGCRCYIYRIQYPDSLSDINNVTMVFYGQIDSPELTEDKTFKCSIVSDIPNMDNCRTFGYACSNQFGDENCRFTPRTASGACRRDAWVVNGVTRPAIYSEALGYTYWKDGIITIAGLSRRVVGQQHNMVIIEYEFPEELDMSGGMKIVQNCDKTVASCKAYGNLKRYGGFLYVPFEYQVKT